MMASLYALTVLLDIFGPFEENDAKILAPFAFVFFGTLDLKDSLSIVLLLH
jgi:hypothetical protein